MSRDDFRTEHLRWSATNPNRVLLRQSTWSTFWRGDDCIGPPIVISSVSVKRVYEPEDPSDGRRMLVDRLWPRGIKRQEIPEGSWLRDVAPSDELRNWFRHDESRFEEFADRYRSELDRSPVIAGLLDLDGSLTLLTAVRTVEISHAAVLRDYLLERIDT